MEHTESTRSIKLHLYAQLSVVIWQCWWRSHYNRGRKTLRWL